MSQLKEQWGNLMKTRSGGSHSPMKSSFVATYKPTFSQHVPGLGGVGEIAVKPEFEAFRAKVQSRMAELQSISIGIKKEAPAAAVKQFMFGLNVPRAQTSPVPEKRKQTKGDEPQQVKTIDSIARLAEADRRAEPTEEDQWEFEIASVAHRAFLGQYVENPDKDLTLTADIGPLARVAASQRFDEVSSPKLLAVELDSAYLSEDRLEFADVANFALGRFPKHKVLDRFRVPQSVEKPTKMLSILIDTPQSYASPVNQPAEKPLSPREATHGKSKSVVPELISRTQDSFAGVNKQQLEGELEVKIAELVVTLKESEGDYVEKIQRISEQLQKDAAAARSEHERLKVRLLIQFLQEYQRVKVAKSGRKKTSVKPAVPRVRRTPKSDPVPPALDPSVYYYSPHNSGKAKAGLADHSFPPNAVAQMSEPEATGALVMRQGWSTATRPAVLQAKYSPLKHESPAPLSPLNPSNSSTKRSYANATAASTIKAAKKTVEADPPSLWIGGTKHKDEFDDPSWVSPSEDSGKRKTQPRQMREKPSSGESPFLRSVTPL